MKYIISIAAILSVVSAPIIASPTLAAGTTTAPAVTCSTADPSAFKPKSDLEAMLTKAGLTVKQIKTEKGCYEVYATDKDGKKVNSAYNAETLEQVANAEAGEN